MSDDVHGWGHRLRGLDHCKSGGNGQSRCLGPANQSSAHRIQGWVFSLERLSMFVNCGDSSIRIWRLAFSLWPCFQLWRRGHLGFSWSDSFLAVLFLFPTRRNRITTYFRVSTKLKPDI